MVDPWEYFFNRDMRDNFPDTKFNGWCPKVETPEKVVNNLLTILNIKVK